MFFVLFYSTRGIKINHSPRTSFDEYFPDKTITEKLGSKEYNSRIAARTSGIIYVYNAYAYDFTLSEGGCALYCQGVSILVVEESTFSNCIATSALSGGAIYFNSGTGQFVVSKTCGYKCGIDHSSLSSGQFIYSKTESGTGYKSHIYDTTIASCSKFQKQSSALYLKYGDCYLKGVNISKNTEFDEYTALTADPYGYNSFRIAYSSFVNNTGNQG